MHRRWLLIAPLVILALAAWACGDDKTAATPTTSAATAAPTPAVTTASGRLILASTTSTQDSGLLDELVPMFEAEYGYDVQVVAVGSGAAIEQGARGDADVLLVHSPAAEKTMVADGNGIERALVMHNDFIIVGPETDPSAVKAAATAIDAMKAIASGKANFISRGDDSGTHALEKKLWSAAALTPFEESWYEESGQGMGATLQIANQKAAYTISDRGTWLAQEKNLDLPIIFEGDKALYNVYHVIVVNPQKHADVNAIGARAFAAFVVRPDVQAFIATFGVAEFGRALFDPDGGETEP